MRWLLMTAEASRLAADLTQYLEERGQQAQLWKADVLIPETLLQHDVVVLLSEALPCLYGGALAALHGRRVLPDPTVTWTLHNRWEADLYLRRSGLNLPPSVMGYRHVLQQQLPDDFFPAVSKPLSGTSLQRSEVIEHRADLGRGDNDEPLYLQHRVGGCCHSITFVGHDMLLPERLPPETSGELKELLEEFRRATGLRMGQLEVVAGDGLWVVEAAAFPRLVGVEDAAARVGAVLLESVHETGGRSPGTRGGRDAGFGTE